MSCLQAAQRGATRIYVNGTDRLVPGLWVRLGQDGADAAARNALISDLNKGEGPGGGVQLLGL